MRRVRASFKFAVAVRKHELLSARSTEHVWTGKANGGRYGYGFEVRQYNGARVVGHGGGWYGVTNHVDVYPNLGYTFVVLSNYDVDTTGVIPNVQFKVREWLTQGRP